MNITPRSLELFLAFARDADNWSGTPLIGGNVPFTKADEGNLTQLKIAGLVKTFEDGTEGGRKSGAPLFWVDFTDAGRALAKEHGIEIS
jgi:hypothetical protein